MTLLPEVKSWLGQTGRTLKEIKQLHSAEQLVLKFCDHPPCFIKTDCGAPKDFFLAQATCLKTIACTHSLGTPKVFHAEHHFIALEYLPPSAPRQDYWETFATQLAKMHQQSAPCFGFDLNTYCGATPQPNPKTLDGFEFFAQHRLLYQADLAVKRGLLEQTTLDAIMKICQRLPDIIPNTAPCLLHGDLWSGNHLPDANGMPTLIDPACYWGWAEADIAMTLLFGGFPKRFYQAYEDRYPLHTDWLEHAGLYNLYHLLNHLNLFGTGYLGQVLSTVKRYQ